MTKTLLFALVLACLAWVTSTAWATDYTCSILYLMSAPAGVDGINMDPQITNGMAFGSGHIPQNRNAGSYALVWTSSGSVTNLNPGNLGFVASLAFGSDGISQVGNGTMSSANGGSTEALLWTGTAESAVNLNPTGYTNSVATGVYGNQQVGRGTAANGITAALLWTGNAASAISLNPPGDKNCGLTATDGVNQVGYTDSGPAMWSGTAASEVSLAPTELPDIYNASPEGVDVNEQVGFGSSRSANGREHAVMWFGTAASAIDLNPPGFYTSDAKGTNGVVQVGWGNPGNGASNEATVWSGTAASAVDLQSLLPNGGANASSEADSVDANGNIFGIAFDTINNFSGYYAVEWSPVPEPALVILPLIALIAQRRR